MNNKIRVIEFLNMIANKELNNTKFLYLGGYFIYNKSNNHIDKYTESNYEKLELSNVDLFSIDSLNENIQIIE